MASIPSPDAARRLSTNELDRRLRRFEDAEAVRRCVNRYMVLCDALDASTPIDELLDCFTPEATWAGKGQRYGKSFGGYKGRDQIGAMFRRYMGHPPHFALNVHFLANEQITPQPPDDALATWVMLQTSTFADGSSHLNAARLTLGMKRCDDGAWRIHQFATENLFSRPVDHWNSASPLPVPPASQTS